MSDAREFDPEGVADALCDPFRVDPFFVDCTGGGAWSLPPAIEFMPFQGKMVAAQSHLILISHTTVAKAYRKSGLSVLRSLILNRLRAAYITITNDLTLTC